MILFSTLHDPKTILLPLLDRLPNNIFQEFQKVIFSCSSSTDSQVVDKLRTLKVEIIDSGESAYSKSKRIALKKAVEEKEEIFFYCDADKIINWNLEKRSEFTSLIKKGLSYDFLIIGRDKKTFSTYPESWIKTEKITNKLLSKAIDLNVDALTATCIMSRKAAKVIVKSSVDNDWQSPVEWPLIAHSHNLSLGYENAKGLMWEDPTLFKKEILKFGEYEKWLKRKYDSTEEWAKRLESCTQQVNTIKRLSS